MTPTNIDASALDGEKMATPTCFDSIVVLARDAAESTLDWIGWLAPLADRAPVFIFLPDVVSHDSSAQLPRGFRIETAACRPHGWRHINEVLCSQGRTRPIFLVDGLAWADFISRRYAALRVFRLTRREASVLLGDAGTGYERLHAEASEARMKLKYGAESSLQEAEARIARAELAARARKAQHFADLMLLEPGAVAGDLGEDAPTTVPWPDTPEALCEQLAAFPRRQACRTGGRLNIAVLYDDCSTHINTVREHLESFRQYSRHSVHYVPVSNGASCRFDLSVFDVAFIHYGVRLYLGAHLSTEFADVLRAYGGYKAVFIQDEYDLPEEARRWIESLGLHAVFTCVPEPYVDQVYPASRFPHLDRIPVLTGYVSPALETMTPTPIAGREKWIGHRGRALPAWYGNLAREKLIIGQRMRDICEQRGIPVDIEWDDSQRIYGDAWYHFVGSCRATLGTESGSNVFDDTGEIRRCIQDAQKANPDIAYEELFERFLAPHDGKIQMNQVSPRIFEAVALGTALILFEGTYSGVVAPDVHFIPLKKDFSNIDDVLARVADVEGLQQMAQRAHDAVIKSGLYSYRRFVESIDAYLDARVRQGSGLRLICSVAAAVDPYRESLDVIHRGFARGLPTGAVLSYETQTYPHGFTGPSLTDAASCVYDGISLHDDPARYDRELCEELVLLPRGYRLVVRPEGSEEVSLTLPVTPRPGRPERPNQMEANAITRVCALLSGLPGWTDMQQDLENLSSRGCIRTHRNLQDMGAVTPKSLWTGGRQLHLHKELAFRHDPRLVPLTRDDDLDVFSLAGCLVHLLAQLRGGAEEECWRRELDLYRDWASGLLQQNKVRLARFIRTIGYVRALEGACRGALTAAEAASRAAAYATFLRELSRNFDQGQNPPELQPERVQATLPRNGAVRKSRSHAEDGAPGDRAGIDQANAEFWDELCGTGLAVSLGITDNSPESLAKFDRWYLDFYPYLLRRVPVHTMRGKRVLEVGLGYGTLGQKIAEAGADYTGLDIARKPVQLMNFRMQSQNLGGRAMQGSMLDCPFPDASFDCVVSIGCLHHTGDLQKCLDQVWRVLRPGGRAYLMVYNRNSLRQWRSWPREVWRAVLRDVGICTASEVSSDAQRSAYDANQDGTAAPETVFTSTRGLRKMMKRYTRVRFFKENADPMTIRGRSIPRDRLLATVGRFLGLDIYVQAEK